MKIVKIFLLLEQGYKINLDAVGLMQILNYKLMICLQNYIKILEFRI